MSAYLSEIKSLCDQLDSIRAPITEHEKIYGVLNDLGKEYELVCAVIENARDNYPAPCFEDIVYKLTGFEDKQQSYQPPVDVTPHQAFYTNRGCYFGRGRRRYIGGYRGRGSYTTQGRGFPQLFGQSAQCPQNTADNRPTCQICSTYLFSFFSFILAWDLKNV